MTFQYIAINKITPIFTVTQFYSKVFNSCSAVQNLPVNMFCLAYTVLKIFQAVFLNWENENNRLPAFLNMESLKTWDSYSLPGSKKLEQSGRCPFYGEQWFSNILGGHAVY